MAAEKILSHIHTDELGSLRIGSQTEIGLTAAVSTVHDSQTDTEHKLCSQHSSRYDTIRQSSCIPAGLTQQGALSGGQP